MSQIKTTTLRFDLEKPEEAKAWEQLHRLDRSHFKSAAQLVTQAVNEYANRQDLLAVDPYLETREREERFLQEVLQAVRQGAQEAMPMVMAGQLLVLLRLSLENAGKTSPESVQKSEAPTEEIEDAAMSFLDSF